MTDWPKAVREWEEKRSSGVAWGDEYAVAAIEVLKYVVHAREVALEEVEAERDSLWKLVLHASKVAPEDVSARLLLALAEVERLRWMLDEAVGDQYKQETHRKAYVADLAARYRRRKADDD